MLITPKTSSEFKIMAPSEPLMFLTH